MHPRSFLGGDDSSAHDMSTGGALFRSLPRQHILTVRMDTPEPWNVQATSASQDIDNLRCDAISCGDKKSQQKELTQVTYTLKTILAAGQCFDVTDGNAAGVGGGMGPSIPPNGLQLTISASPIATISTDSYERYKADNNASVFNNSMLIEPPISSDTLVMQVQYYSYYRTLSENTMIYLLLNA